MRHGLLEQFKLLLKNSYVRYVCVGFLIAVAIGGSFLVYRLNRNKLQQKAQAMLSESLDEYAIMKTTGDAEQYAEAERMFQQGYEKAKNSTLAPIFLVYKADAQTLQGKLDDAHGSLNAAMKALSKESPYYPLYEIKQALLAIDAECGVQECPEDSEALTKLVKIANDKLHPYRTVAMNYLAEYYASSGDFQKAQKISAEFDKLVSQEIGVQGLL